MKIIIKESRADDLILKYLEKYIHPDYGWGSELFDFYQREIRKYGYVDFTINDDSAYVFLNDKDLGELNTLMIRDTTAETLNGLFGNRWHNIFIKWFEDNTNLPVEHFKIEKKMNIIISESQVKYLIKKFFKKDFSDKIQMIQSWDDLPYKFKRVMGDKRTLNLYLNDFGPMYLILADGEEYLVQEREGKWAIVDEADRPIKESKLMDLLGIAPLGLSVGEFINAYVEELPV